jgi:hypothetical protein
MTDKGKEKTFAIADLKHKTAENFRRVYSNNSNIAANFFDMTVLFGEVIIDPEGTDPFLNDEVAVTMSWEHAKALLDGLARALTDYEQSNKQPIRRKPD